ncbi:hypothetical protein H5410_019613 [Solanum commersonii]|uniref:Uncharacterized protein n=1 Tax=Solanum commersonii TaxID=4109 RepID=A0A9J5ZA25_SOLCO|nr:hypothetical protein H5410_019613 [Solanum commersonii]
MLMDVLAKRRPKDEEIFSENLGMRESIRRIFPTTMMEVVDVNLFRMEEEIHEILATSHQVIGVWSFSGDGANLSTKIVLESAHTSTFTENGAQTNSRHSQ